MMSRMEMIYIDSDRAGRKTGVGATMDTPAETWAAFRSVRRHEVPIEQASFLLDYYNRRGDLADTIAISASTFRRITGQPVLSEDEYRDVDLKFWTDARDAIAAQRKEGE